MPRHPRSSSRSLLVAFEGLNGAGKTTLSMGVAKELGWARVRTPPFEESKERSLFEDDPFSAAAMLYYLSWVVFVDQQVEAGLLGPAVICDRYLQSTVAYFGGVGRPVDSILDVVSIRPADITVLVTVEETLRWDRILAQRIPRTIDEVSRECSFQEFALQTFRSGSRVLEVDTTTSEPAENIARCADLVRACLALPGD